MTEQDHPTPAPSELHRIKDELVDLWQQLPVEHQATMSLVLVNQVMQSEMGEWLKEAWAIQWSGEQQTEASMTTAVPISWVSRRDLLHSHPEREQQIEALTNDEIEYIAEKVGDALQETYWQALGIVLGEYFGEADLPGDEGEENR
jgi:hypothetical protein